MDNKEILNQITNIIESMNSITELMKNYKTEFGEDSVLDILNDEGVKSALDVVDDIQYSCISDTSEKWLEADQMRVYLYLQYTKEYFESRK